MPKRKPPKRKPPKRRVPLEAVRKTAKKVNKRKPKGAEDDYPRAFKKGVDGATWQTKKGGQMNTTVPAKSVKKANKRAAARAFAQYRKAKP